jgi:hypothetical protein
MRSLFRSATIVGTFAAIVALAGTASAAPTYQWQYSVDGGAFTTLTLSDPDNNTASVSLFSGKLTIGISTNSNNPGTALGAELFNATTDVVNSTGATHTVVVKVSENGYTAPSTPSMLTAAVGPVTVRRDSLADPTSASGSFTASASVSGTNTLFGSTTSTNVYSDSGSTGVGGAPKSLSNATLTNGAFVAHGTPFSMTVSNSIVLGKNTSTHIEIDADFSPNPQAVPEPSTLVVAGIGALGMIGFGLRRRKALGA